MFLTSLYDFVIEEAEDGLEGLKKFNSFNPHIVITDNSMPGMCGLELTKAIRGLGSSCFIAMMSARVHPEFSAQILQAGANDFFSKPFEVRKLQEIVEKGKLESGVK